jgi:uncharacterized YigZ family protein
LKTDHFFTIERVSIAEFKDRGSRFIAYANPLADAIAFRKWLQQLRKEHPKAVHHCYAYRFGTAGDQFRTSDDGEPSGTAGKPILGQIDSKNITDTGIVVVRYFGGSLLGVPGLINAYKTAASLALQTVPIIMNDVMLVLKQLQCEVIKQESELFPRIELRVPIKSEEDFLQKLTELRNVEIKK